MNHDILEKCKELYLSGSTLKEISSICGIAKQRISYEIRLAGVTTREDGRKYEVRSDAFEKIDDEVSSYWLGFLYADGSVTYNGRSTIELSLGGKDIDHLKKFRDWISPKSPIRERVIRLESNGKKYLSCRLMVYSIKVANDIIQLGCIPNKTFSLKFPSLEQVPSKYVHHFMRGYFDGDGSASSKRFSVLGNYEFIEAYSNIMYNNGVSNGNIRKHSNIYMWERYKKCDINIIYRFLYDNATIYLERKEKQLSETIAPYISNNVSGAGELSGSP